MEHIYHIGKCPICTPYGQMEILFDCSAGKCFVMCDECSIEFQSVDDYNKTNGKRIFYKENEKIPPVRPAALNEIKDTEWYSLIIDN